MEVKYNSRGILIVAETEFERTVINSMFQNGGVAGFVKHGFTASDTIGVQIEPIHNLIEDEPPQPTIRESENLNSENNLYE